MKRKIKTHRIESLKIEYFERQQKVCDKKLYRTIIRDYFKMATERLIDGDYFKLYQSLGTLKVIRTNPKTLRVYDHGTTKDYNSPNFYLNLDADRKIFKWKWDNKNARFKNHRLWRFYPMHKNRKLITKKVREGEAFYFRNAI